jgi:hypothetical protein
MGEKCVGCLIAARNFRQFASVLISPLTIHANLHFSLKNQAFACLIMRLPNLLMSAICKLGKGIN